MSLKHLQYYALGSEEGSAQLCLLDYICGLAKRKLHQRGANSYVVNFLSHVLEQNVTSVVNFTPRVMNMQNNVKMCQNELQEAVKVKDKWM